MSTAKLSGNGLHNLSANRLNSQRFLPPPAPLHPTQLSPVHTQSLWLPEDVAEQESSTIPQRPVVIQGVDGGSQWLQDTVEDTAHQGADIGPQTQVWIPNQAPCHLQEPMQLLQVMAYGFHLVGEEESLGTHEGASGSALSHLPTKQPPRPQPGGHSPH